MSAPSEETASAPEPTATTSDQPEPSTPDPVTADEPLPSPPTCLPNVYNPRRLRPPPASLPMGRRVRLEPDHWDFEDMTGHCDPLLLQDRTGAPFQLDRRLLSPVLSERTEPPTRAPSLRTMCSAPFEGSIEEEADDETDDLTPEELAAWQATRSRRKSPPENDRSLRRSTPDQTLHQLRQAERTLRRRIENEQAAAARRQFLAVKNHLVSQIEEDPAGATLRLGEAYLVMARALVGEDAANSRVPVSLRIAIDWLHRSINHDGDRAEPHYLLGRAHDQAGYRDEASAAYKAACERDPGRARYWCSLGVLHCAEERFDEARDAFEHAVQAADARLQLLQQRSPVSDGGPIDGEENELQARADISTATANIAQLYLHFGELIGGSDLGERLDRAAAAFERAAESSATPESRQLQLERLDEVRVQQDELKAKTLSTLATSDIPKPSPGPSSADLPSSDSSDSSFATQRIGSPPPATRPIQPSTEAEAEAEVFRLLREQLAVSHEIRRGQIEAEEPRHAELLAAVNSGDAIGSNALVRTDCTASDLLHGSAEARIHALARIGERSLSALLFEKLNLR